MTSTAMMKETVLLLLVLATLVQLTLSQANIGECVVSEGYIMDVFCINRGTLFDNPSLQTLVAPGPARHSIHCLVDVGICVNSGYAVLSDNGDNTYSVGYVLDDFGTSQAKALAEQSGAPGTCILCDGSAGGTQTQGFQAKIVGEIESLGDPSSADEVEKAPSLKVLQVLSTEDTTTPLACQQETSPSLSPTTVTPDPTPAPSTMAPSTLAPTGAPLSVPIVVRNNHFERDNQKWKVIKGNPTRECGTGNEQSGDCCMAFEGSAATSQRIKQKIGDIEGGQAGDTFRLVFWLKGEDVARKNDFKAFMKFKGPTETVTMACKSRKAGTFGYKEMECTFASDIPFNTASLFFEYKGSSGAVYLDRLSLYQELY